MSPPEQRMLGDRVRAGDVSAEDEIIRLYYPAVMALLVCRTRDREASRDLAQDTFMAALQAIRSGQVQDPEKLATYIQGIARNIANNHLRIRVIRRVREEELPPDWGDRAAGPLHQAGLDETAREKAVQQALDALGSPDREVLLLTLDGRQPREIALSLHLRADLVRQRKTRAIQKIKESLRKMSQTGKLRHFLSERNQIEL